MHLTVCSCHVTYAFESESTLYSCLNVKELLARKEFLDIQATVECGFTLKRVRDKTRTYSISIFFLSLSLGIFVCHTIKTFLFSRFKKIKGVFVSIFVFTFFVSFLSRRLLLSGDIETNPGPRRNLSNHFTICHWNLNSISAHNFANVQLLKAYLAVHKFDIVCLSETYLNSSFPFDDDNFDIPGYIMIRVNHPANSKRGGVCMYYKNCLPLKVLDIRFLHESIAFELRIGDKLCSFISLYRSPNQSSDDFV